jgi:endonuclease/exonuclease/phosphatase family metal-dependent hydrolase
VRRRYPERERSTFVPTITLCSFNAEWMNDWFTPDAGPVGFRPTFTRDGHTSDTQTTAGRTAALIRALDADVLALQEAPSRPAEVQLFVDAFLSDGGAPLYDFFLGDSGIAQKLALLYKPGTVSAALASHADITMLVGPFNADVDGDALLEEYSFTRTPLVVNLTLGGNTVQVIVLHTKSNFINNGQQLWENPATHQNYITVALKDRRRIAAEGTRVRRYVDTVLDAQPVAAVVVLGDLNDGPGMDFFEENYLARNVTDTIVGTTFAPEKLLRHAQHDVPAAERYTAVFDDFVENVKDRKLLLDHILLSPGIADGGSGVHKVAGSGTVFHAAYDAQTVNHGVNREDRPSDHRPVGVTLEF